MSNHAPDHPALRVSAVTAPRSRTGQHGAFAYLYLLYLFAVLLTLGVWLGVWLQLRNETANADEDGRLQAQLAVRDFAAYCKLQLQNADHAAALFQALQGAQEQALRLDGFWLNRDPLHTVLNFEQAHLRLYHARGHLLQQFPAQTVESALPPQLLKAFAEKQAQQRIGPRRSDGAHWQIHFLRRLQNASGVFSGVLQIGVDPFDLLDEYAPQAPAVSLMLRNMDSGAIITRHPQQTLIETDWTLQARPEGGARLLRKGENPAAAPTAYFAVQDLPGFGVQAIAALPRNFTQRYQQARRLYLAFAAFFTLLIGGAVARLHWQTRRIQASERAALEAQSVLSAAAEGSLDAFYILQAVRNGAGEVIDFTIEHVNQRGAHLLGMPVQALKGERLCALLPGFKKLGYFAQYVQVLESGQTLEQEFELRIKQVKARWLHHQIVTTGNGVAITVRDISQRKEAEQELRNNRNFLRSLVDNLPVLVAVAQVHAGAQRCSLGKLLVWNKYAEQISRVSAQEMLGQDLSSEQAQLNPAITRIIDRLNALLQAGVAAELTLEEEILHSDGRISYLHLLALFIDDEQGKPEYLMCIGEDISLRRRHEHALRASQAELAAVNDASPLGLVRADANASCTYVNKTFELISGLTREQALGNGWLQAVHTDDRPMIEKALQSLRHNQEWRQGVFRFVHQDGRLVWASVKIAAIVLDARIAGYVGSVDDITQRREAEIALIESEARLRTITNTMPAMLAYVDAQEHYRFWNLAYEREIGIDMHNCEGKPVLEVVGPKRYAIVSPYIKRALAGETVQYEDDVSTHGKFRMLECTYIPQLAQDGKTVLGFHVMRHDITAKKLEEMRLLQLAQLDVLTGLSNRAGFMQKLRDAMAKSRQSGALMALMFMDIDYFKAVNDTHGHRAGDLLLAAFAERLRHSLRASDSIARLGGDEFTVLMESPVRVADAQMIAEKIVQVMRQPFTLDKLELKISTSLGLAWFHGGELTADALLNQADMMLYQAKRNGRDTWRMHEAPQMDVESGHS
ncbi:PAS domain S-box protein [Massilia sp. W12]|uniref:PAS domain S-box protein n=1 Tax=Massilia sp. W12 TaxID=3126507 RepID=UPI0030D38099